MLKNEPTLAIVAVDTEENGPFLFFNLNPAPVLICVEVPRPLPPPLASAKEPMQDNILTNTELALME